MLQPVTPHSALTNIFLIDQGHLLTDIAMAETAVSILLEAMNHLSVVTDWKVVIDLHRLQMSTSKSQSELSLHHK